MEELFGKGIFNSINLHLLDLASGKTKRLTTYKDSRDTVRKISNRYLNATKRIHDLLQESKG